jgi:bifunctional non-homologous end joining protein LigD
MALETYRAKRDFRRTPEPSGRKRSATSTGHSFVVQKHAASHLHYDFRLELNGVLLSWAIPKGPSLDPADKRLAMHVEDHPLDYGGFEGVIPKGEYGGGTVMVWDRGTWTPQGDPVAGYKKGELKFTLDGEKLKGGWVLVRTRGSKYGGKTGDKAWLLIKERDAHARPGNGAIIDEAPDSVVTGRALEEIARARQHVWQSKLSAKDNVRAGAIVAPTPQRKGSAKASGASVTGARKATMPASIAPVLATLVDRAPAGDDWINEVKYDGYRMVCRIERGRARLISRNGKDWTNAFPSVAKDLATLPVKTAWIDGEVVVLDAEGRTNFQALQNALTGAPARGLAFFAFDLIYCDGYDLRGAPLTERKRRLHEVVGNGVGTVRLGPEVRGGSGDFFRQACSLGLEGAICKKADSLYAAGTRSRDWLKVKCVRRQEMVIGGFTDPQGARTGFGALLLGVYENGELRYAGKVGTGFDEATLRKLAPQFRKREQKEAPFVNPPRGYAAKGAHWLRPDLVAEVAFTEWSADGALRHPAFMGLRLDKKATDVVRERAVKASANGAKETPAAAARRPAAKRAVVKRDVERSAPVAGVELSHPEKVYFPEAGLTKRDLAEYYASVAPHLLPHVTKRPLSLVRCPDGWPRQCFYQKHADPSVHKSVARIEVPEGKGTATYLGASSATALVALVQWGVIEMHPWGSRAPRLDRPDRLIFDFDPDEKLEWKELVTAVGLLHALFDEMKLACFLKTTGGKGLHVVLPIRPALTWDDTKAFSKAVADFLVRTFPDRFTATMAKDKRKGKIFIDYLRNSVGATAIAPYAVRARANAPVATPIDWSELERDVRFDHFTIRNVPERLARLRADPWAKFQETRQAITAAMRKRLA